MNSISHLIGAILALAGLVVLIVFASLKGNPQKIVSFSIYGVCLFLLYILSTLYHSFKGKSKKVFRRLDYIGIYFLIAGTYTPFSLVSLRGAWGWSLFGIVWGMALIGILFDLFVSKSRRIVPLVLYLLMGWLGLIVIKPLILSLSVNGFIGLLIGGVFYTLGVVFYLLDDRYPYFHAIWHGFVLAGSVAHYITIMLYVL